MVVRAAKTDVRVIAIILLLAVFVRHESAFWLADATGFNPRAVHYMLGGAYEVVLAGVIAVFLLAANRSLWRNLGLAAMAIAAIEGAQITACRAMVKDMKQVPPDTNLCDWIVGVPMGHILMSFYLLIVVWSIADASRAG